MGKKSSDNNETNNNDFGCLNVSSMGNETERLITGKDSDNADRLVCCDVLVFIR